MRPGRRSAALLLGAGLACGGDGGAPVARFPEGFLFGAATAGFQVDMGCPTLAPERCADRASDWYAYVKSPRLRRNPFTFLSGEDPALVGPGHWELFRDDLDLARDELAGNAFRMSIEWSRIFPAPTDGIEDVEELRAVADADALAHYHAVFGALAERGLTPFVTLHHYTMPSWIHDAVGCTLDLASCERRGWLDRERTVREIAKYAGFVAAEFGAEVDLWATQNEPFAVLLPGFVLPSPLRSQPPAKLLHLDAAKQVLVAMAEAHARMFDAVHAADRSDADGDGVAAEVGLVYAVVPAAPRDPSSAVDRRAAEDLVRLYDLVFLDAVALGQLDDDLDGTPTFRPDLAGRMDFIGMNYKTRAIVSGVAGPGGRPLALLPGFSPLTTFDPFTLDLSDVHAPGIHEMALLLTERYGLPIHLTEHNGQSVPEGRIDEEIRNVALHLAWLARAIEDGADVRSYFYWSLMDNFEWNHGTDFPLGLYAVDPADLDKERVARETVPVYAEVARSRGLTRDLLERAGVSADAVP